MNWADRLLLLFLNEKAVICPSYTEGGVTIIFTKYYNLITPIFITLTFKGIHMMRMDYHLILYISKTRTHCSILKGIILQPLSTTEESFSTQLPFYFCLKRRTNVPGHRWENKEQRWSTPYVPLVGWIQVFVSILQRQQEGTLNHPLFKFIPPLLR